MNIEEAIIHGLIKEKRNDDVTERFRTELSAIDNRMQTLGEGVLKEYAKQSDSYGTFDADENTFPFAKGLREYYQGNVDLLELSLTTSRLLKKQMSESPLSTSVYILFIRYENMGRDWLLAVMLKLKASTGVDPETLELKENLSFDINSLHEAARIDLEKWREDEQPYLSFIKKGRGKDDVTKYFRLALGCTEYTDSSYNTDQAVKAVDAYCKHKNYGEKEVQAARQKLHEYFDEKYNSVDKTVHLKALSGIINDGEPDDFYDFVKNEDIPVSDKFSPAKKIYDKLRVISGKFGTVSVRFEAKDVIRDYVDYDEHKKVLIIKNVPPALIGDIRKAKGYDPE